MERHDHHGSVLAMGKVDCHGTAEEVMHRPPRTRVTGTDHDHGCIQMVRQGREGLAGIAGQGPERPPYGVRVEETPDVLPQAAIRDLLGVVDVVRVDRHAAHAAVRLFIDGIPPRVHVRADELRVEVTREARGMLEDGVRLIGDDADHNMAAHRAPQKGGRGRLHERRRVKVCCAART